MRVSSVVLSAVVAVCLFAVPAHGAQVFGDVNGDGEVNAVDIQLVINAVLGIPIDPSYNPDVNEDDDVNAVDIQLVINVVLGIITEPDPDPDEPDDPEPTPGHKTFTYWSEWDSAARQHLLYAFEDGESVPGEEELFSIQWAPRELSAGEAVMIGGLEFVVEQRVGVALPASDTAVEAWELVYEEEGFEAYLLYDTARGTWLGGEFTAVVDGAEETLAYTLVDTNIPLATPKAPGPEWPFNVNDYARYILIDSSAPEENDDWSEYLWEVEAVEEATVTLRETVVDYWEAEEAKSDAAPRSEALPLIGAGAAKQGGAGNQLVMEAPYLQSATRAWETRGWGSILTNEVDADRATGAIAFELLGAAQGGQTLRTSHMALGQVIQRIWIPCDGFYELEFAGHANFDYAMGATDVTVLPMRKTIPLPTNRARFNARAGFRITGHGFEHQHTETIIDNASLTNFHTESMASDWEGATKENELGYAGGTARKNVELSTGRLYLEAGLYRLEFNAEAGINIGRGLLSRTVAEIQGQFDAETVTVTWPYGLPPVQRVETTDWESPDPPEEGCLEMDVDIVAGLFADGATVYSARQTANVPLRATVQPGEKSHMDMTYYEGQAVFEVEDIETVYEATSEGCHTVITPRHGIISVGLEVWEDDAVLHIGAPETPGIDVYMDCPGLDPLEMSLDTWGVFIYNHLEEMMMGQGLRGFELKPQPWNQGENWIAKLEEVRERSETGEELHRTEVNIYVRW